MIKILKNLIKIFFPVPLLFPGNNVFIIYLFKFKNIIWINFQIE